MLGFATVLLLSGALYAATHWTLEDMDAYWEAALRLRAGEPLYREYLDPTAADVYRYAPWFAFAWVPLTFLPKAIVGVAWSTVLLAACVACLAPLVRHATVASVATAAFLGSFLLTIAAVGNVQPLMVAALLFGLERRAGPVVIGLAASLKAVPILFLLVYLARGEWSKATLGVVVTAILVVPMLVFDLTHYPTDPGQLSISLFNRVPVLWAVLAATLTLAAAWLARRRSPYAWLAMSSAVFSSLPRAFGYDLTFLLCGLADQTSPGRRSRAG